MSSYRELKPRQRIGLFNLKSRLASAGYQIFPISPERRMGPCEFIAVERSSENHFVWVRSYKNGAVAVRPFCMRGQHTPVVSNIIESLKSAKLPVRWGPQIEPSNKKLGIEHYLSGAMYKKLQEIIPHRT